MSFFRRVREPEPLPEPTPDVALEAEEIGPQTEGVWTGGACFGGDGWYYPILLDAYNEEIGPDLTRKLIHVTGEDGGHYEFARPHHRDHNSYMQAKFPEGRDQELVPTSEVLV